MVRDAVTGTARRPRSAHIPERSRVLFHDSGNAQRVDHPTTRVTTNARAERVARRGTHVTRDIIARRGAHAAPVAAS